MKELKYIEGREATRNFEEGMKALFKVRRISDESVSAWIDEDPRGSINRA